MAIITIAPLGNIALIGAYLQKIEIGTVPAILNSSRAITGKANKGKTTMSTGTKAKENESRLWIAVALSMSMIFTSYIVSVTNHQEDTQVNANTQSHRPIVVGYLA